MLVGDGAGVKQGTRPCVAWVSVCGALSFGGCDDRYLYMLVCVLAFVACLLLLLCLRCLHVAVFWRAVAVLFVRLGRVIPDVKLLGVLFSIWSVVLLGTTVWAVGLAPMLFPGSSMVVPWQRLMQWGALG